MKVYNKCLLVLCGVLFLLPMNINAQHESKIIEGFSPTYILMTTMHWNSNPDLDFEEWKAVEQEYFDKVTNKNKFILGAGVYRHFITPDDSEILFVTVYDSLGAIEDAIDVSNDLMEKGWPDEAEKIAFFEKQKSFYTGVHSDEIMTSLPFQKDLVTNSKEPLLYYVRKSKVGGEEGGGYKEYFENILMNNEYVRGYYTQKHRFGSNSTDAMEIAVFENLADFEAAFVENDRLVHEYWPDETERKIFFKEFKKIFSGHGDYLYQNVPSLAK